MRFNACIIFLRARFEEMAEKDRDRYDKAKKAYQKKLKEEANGIKERQTEPNSDEEDLFEDDSD